jgi:hypothetical protein
VDELGQQHVDSLIPRGWQRAGALAALLGATTPSTPPVRHVILTASDDVLVISASDGPYAATVVSQNALAGDGTDWPHPRGGSQARFRVVA